MILRHNPYRRKIRSAARTRPERPHFGRSREVPRFPLVDVNGQHNRQPVQRAQRLTTVRRTRLQPVERLSSESRALGVLGEPWPEARSGRRLARCRLSALLLGWRLSVDYLLLASSSSRFATTASEQQIPPMGPDSSVSETAWRRSAERSKLQALRELELRFSSPYLSSVTSTRLNPTRPSTFGKSVRASVASAVEGHRSATLTSSLPRLSPRKSPMKAFGACSSPSTTSSR